MRAPDLLPVAAGLTRTRWSDYRAQVEAAVDDVDPHCIVGASLGGLLALASAPRTHALVLINALPPAPWPVQVPTRSWPAQVAWRLHARLDSTRRALPDADEATVLHAFRHWRDESGAVLRAASEGIELPPPRKPCLLISTRDDADVPPRVAHAMAGSWEADLLHVRGGHLSPLMGPLAAAIAGQAVEWMNAQESAG